jgi:hypothetical protein
MVSNSQLKRVPGLQKAYQFARAKLHPNGYEHWLRVVMNQETARLVGELDFRRAPPRSRSAASSGKTSASPAIARWGIRNTTSAPARSTRPSTSSSPSRCSSTCVGPIAPSATSCGCSIRTARSSSPPPFWSESTAIRSTARAGPSSECATGWRVQWLGDGDGNDHGGSGAINLDHGVDRVLHRRVCRARPPLGQAARTGAALRPAKERSGRRRVKGEPSLTPSSHGIELSRKEGGWFALREAP